jgi:hypothetical protein
VSTPERTDVLLTADIEFDINGALKVQDKYKPLGTESVHRRIDGKSEGLGFILNTLNRHSLPGIFFIEVFNAHYFGTEPMASIAKEIAEAGPHELQLHTHLGWTHYGKPSMPPWNEIAGTLPQSDSMVGLDLPAAGERMREAVALFQEMAGHKPTAFRPGNYWVDENTLRAAALNGIAFSSAVGLGAYRPAEQALRLYGGIKRVYGLTEIPTLSFLETRPLEKHEKLFTVTGTSYAQAVEVLEKAHRERIGPVVILTHASEFAYNRAPVGSDSPNFVRNSINQKKFERLCHYFARNRERFRVTTFGEAGERFAEREIQLQAPLETSLFGFLTRATDALRERAGIY